jgi:hypothetical protein
MRFAVFINGSDASDECLHVDRDTQVNIQVATEDGVKEKFDGRLKAGTFVEQFVAGIAELADAVVEGFVAVATISEGSDTEAVGEGVTAVVADIGSGGFTRNTVVAGVRVAVSEGCSTDIAFNWFGWRFRWFNR